MELPYDQSWLFPEQGGRIHKTLLAWSCEGPAHMPHRDFQMAQRHYQELWEVLCPVWVNGTPHSQLLCQGVWKKQEFLQFFHLPPGGQSLSLFLLMCFFSQWISTTAFSTSYIPCPSSGKAPWCHTAFPAVCMLCTLVPWHPRGIGTRTWG